MVTSMGLIRYKYNNFIHYQPKKLPLAVIKVGANG